MTNQVLSDRICAAMHTSGHTARSLSDSTGFSLGGISGWMTGKSDISGKSLTKICPVLGVSADWLLGMEGDDALE